MLLEYYVVVRCFTVWLRRVELLSTDARMGPPDSDAGIQKDG